MSLIAPEYCILCGLPTYGAGCQQVFCGKLHETRASSGYDGGEPITVSDGIAEQNRAIYERMTAAETELAEWRRGARRIVWRLRWKNGVGGEYAHDHVSRKNARGVAGYFRRSLDATKASVHRVTIKPKGAS